MKITEKWRRLGWRHPLWDYIRFYTVVRGQRKELREKWIKNLQDSKLEIVPGKYIPIDPNDACLFFDYLNFRDVEFDKANGLLRAEEEALAFCKRMEVEAGKNVTQLGPTAGHRRSRRTRPAGREGFRPIPS